MRVLASHRGALGVLSGVLALEAEHEEQRVEDERGRQGDQAVHEEVELRLLEPVLGQPVEDLVFRQQVSWK